VDFSPPASSYIPRRGIDRQNALEIAQRAFRPANPGGDLYTASSCLVVGRRHPGFARVMGESYRRRKGKQKLLASHQRSWLWGRNLVRETLKAGRWPIVELRLAESLPADELQSALDLAGKLELKAEIVASEVLVQLCHASEHQGYLARMGPFPYNSADELLGRAPAAPLYLILDALQDPYNFGAIIRSAEVFGIEAIFIGQTHQVPVTTMVARSSAGGVNRIPISQVVDLPQLAARLSEKGIQVVGASEKGTLPLPDCDFRSGTAIVIGNEGEGISPALLAECRQRVQIPQVGTLGCLNAAVAAAVFCYEARRQRRSSAI
jgi:23S rRNA (guanosine2251-2'-O)-methyltransferase